MELGLSLSVIPYPFISRLAAENCLLETGLTVQVEMRPCYVENAAVWLIIAHQLTQRR